ncbi:MAG: hypothetical protein K9L02_07900 [Acholeplasmataceae bacterium]|nr:hypothetical protein [Acholeplasmataceae bacterium]
MKNTIDKERASTLGKLNRFTYLQSIRNLDFPMNTVSICKINLDVINNYYEKNILLNKNYSPKLDMILITLITNYLSSIKAYLNRKKREIQNRRLINKDLTMLLQIFEKYRKAKRSETKLDQLITIRDQFEHEKISDIVLTITHNSKRITYKTIDLLELFNDSFDEISQMNKEICVYIEKEMKAINLRNCVLFMNAFNRYYGKKPYSELFPEEATYESDEYDKKILELLK